MNRPAPPRPELVRQPTGGFGWLDQRLLHERWLAQVGPNATALLVLLALAADRHGASFFSRERMSSALGMNRHELDDALRSLQQAGLLAHRPWRSGHQDGVWQLLPVPDRNHRHEPRVGRVVHFADALAALGLIPAPSAALPQQPPTPEKCGN